MGNPFSSPSTDAGHTEDREESGRWPFASHDDSGRRSTAGPYSDDSSSASKLPGFPRILDDKDNGGRRSPVYCLYNAARTWGSKSSVYFLYKYSRNYIAVCEVVIFHITTSKLNYRQYRKLTRHFWSQMLTKRT